MPPKRSGGGAGSKGKVVLPSIVKPEPTPTASAQECDALLETVGSKREMNAHLQALSERLGRRLVSPQQEQFHGRVAGRDGGRDSREVTDAMMNTVSVDESEFGADVIAAYDVLRIGYSEDRAGTRTSPSSEGLHTSGGGVHSFTPSRQSGGARRESLGKSGAINMLATSPGQSVSFSNPRGRHISSSTAGKHGGQYLGMSSMDGYRDGGAFKRGDLSGFPSSAGTTHTSARDTATATGASRVTDLVSAELGSQRGSTAVDDRSSQLSTQFREEALTRMLASERAVAAAIKRLEVEREELKGLELSRVAGEALFLREKNMYMSSIDALKSQLDRQQREHVREVTDQEEAFGVQWDALQRHMVQLESEREAVLAVLDEKERVTEETERAKDIYFTTRRQYVKTMVAVTEAVRTDTVAVSEAMERRVHETAARLEAKVANQNSARHQAVLESEEVFAELQALEKEMEDAFLENERVRQEEEHLRRIVDLEASRREMMLQERERVNEDIVALLEAIRAAENHCTYLLSTGTGSTVVASSNSSSGNTVLRLPAPPSQKRGEDDVQNRQGNEWRNFDSTHPSTQPSTQVVAATTGNAAANRYNDDHAFAASAEFTADYDEADEGGDTESGKEVEELRRVEELTGLIHEREVELQWRSRENAAMQEELSHIKRHRLLQLMGKPSTASGQDSGSDAFLLHLSPAKAGSSTAKPSSGVNPIRGVSSSVEDGAEDNSVKLAALMDALRTVVLTSVKDVLNTVHSSIASQGKDIIGLESYLRAALDPNNDAERASVERLIARRIEHLRDANYPNALPSQEIIAPAGNIVTPRTHVV